MRRSILNALIATLTFGISSTTFAAANPFSDVPAGHWAYNSVSKLAAEGIIEGYGDGTFLGNRNITRYEMAQMIAKAMAKNPSGATKAELDKLASEFRSELDSLGVRVDELEKNSDKIKWTGKIEYTYHNRKVRNTKYKTTSNGYIFRLEPSAEINDHWTANARIDAEGDMKYDSTDHANLKRVWAQGDYDKFQVKLGRFEFYTNEHGLLWDTEFSGAELTFGSKWQATLIGGRLQRDEVAPSYWEHSEEYETGYTDSEGITNPNGTKVGEYSSDVIGLNVQYAEPEDKGFFGGAGFYYIKDKDLVEFDNTDKAKIWSVNLGYRFSDKWKISGDFAQNSKASIEKNAWQTEITFGNYDDAPEKGQWAVWTGYRKFGQNASFSGNTEDDILLGYQGWFIGGAWAPFKNIGLIARYGNNREITASEFGRRKLNHIFGRVEFFF